MALNNNNSLLDEIDPDQHYFDELYSIVDQNQTKYFSVRDYNNLCIENRSHITLMNYNVRSFRANSDTMVSMFYEECSHPEILVLSETWFTDQLQDGLNSYCSYHTVRSNRRSGGVSVFVRQCFSSRKLFDLSFANETIEVCTVDVQIYNQSFIVVGVYRPHSGTVDDFVSQLGSILDSCEVRGRRCIVTGDFNIDLGSDNSPVNNFVNNMHSCHFIPLITKPTRFPPLQNQLPSLLDHIWLNQIGNFNSGIILNDFTDHCPTFVQFPVNNIKNSRSTTKISFRQDCEQNRNKLKLALEAYDWSSLKSNDLDLYVSNFATVLSTLYCDSFPLKVKYVSIKQACNPWITSEIKKLVDSKSKYFNLLKLGAVSRSENNAFKNRVQKIINKSKLIHYRNLLEKNRNDIRGTWRVIGSLATGGASNSSINRILWSNIEYSDPGDIAEIFNNYFSSIATELDEILPASALDPLHYMRNKILSSLSLEPVTPAEVSTIISDLKLTKQHKNNIPVKLIIYFRTVLCVTLCDMINQSFTQGKFPEPLKHALVTPIYKKGDVLDPKNYRPISVLLILSKIFERAIYNRLIKFLSDNSVISLSQFGFTKKKSTRDAILLLTEYLYEALNNKDFTVNIFIDYSRAFDTIQHSFKTAFYFTEASYSYN